jgi:DNA helicase-2/ATP-dependent DNA helicase PcrA
MFGSLEALDTGDLIGFAEIADSSDGPGPVLSALVALADKAIARLPPGFKTRSAKIVAGEAVTYRAGSALSAYTAAAIDFMRTQSNEALAETIAAIAAFPKIVIARQELWGDLEIMVGAALHQSQSHTDAATQTRERARRRGRRPASHVIGTTLLAKGLEYDNVVVTNAGTMDRENLYVALTRATTTLEVLSETRVLSPQES